MDEDDLLPPSPAKPPQVPSWAMLGFILGRLFVLALPHHQPPPPPAVELKQAPVIKYVSVPRLSTIEAVFATWGKDAVWDNDLTEVALWSPETKEFSDCFEVLRLDGNFYFRSIPALTRPLLTHGVKAGSPLEFTETEAQRLEWLRASDEEAWHGSRSSGGPK